MLGNLADVGPEINTEAKASAVQPEPNGTTRTSFLTISGVLLTPVEVLK